MIQSFAFLSMIPGALLHIVSLSPVWAGTVKCDVIQAACATNQLEKWGSGWE
eukprot:NODE_20360_length_264_cov_1.530233_g19191_i0.p2 GENE.NODE_20360_length_264_cov_1.530233_g19191_i0~~NODE_20360_length_264_cov_1.530233_g19191_i0.p2  ORF type:complete len:52 (+),score=6.52 NODE_20360_length_264_cov_1.530233_g19191_i0:89-244(+)